MSDKEGFHQKRVQQCSTRLASRESSKDAVLSNIEVLGQKWLEEMKMAGSRRSYYKNFQELVKQCQTLRRSVDLED